MAHHRALLWLIFIAAFSIRVYYSLTSPHFFDYESYSVLNTLMQIERTKSFVYQPGIINPPSSVFVLPVFYLLFSGFHLAGEMLAVKLLTALISSCLAFVVYLIANKLTKKNYIKLIATGFAVFSPGFLALTTNMLRIGNLTVPLFFLVILLVIKVEKNKANMPWLILTSLLLVLTSKSSLLLLVTLALYFLLLKLQSKQVLLRESDFALFLTFFIYLMIYAISLTELRGQLFFSEWANRQTISFAETISRVSVPILLLGVYGHYVSQKSNPSRQQTLMFAITLAILLLLSFGILDVVSALAFLSVNMSIASVNSLEALVSYLKKFRLASLSKLAILSSLVLICAIVAATSAYQLKSISKEIPNYQIQALQWLGNNYKDNSTLLIPANMGDLAEYYAKKRVVLDPRSLHNLILADRLQDIEKAYKSIYETEALEVLNKYNISYIFFDPIVSKQTGVAKLRYTDDEKCFELIYNQTASIYRVKCVLKPLQ